jgi:hypothetical protein
VDELIVAVDRVILPHLAGVIEPRGGPPRGSAGPGKPQYTGFTSAG